MLIRITGKTCSLIQKFHQKLRFFASFLAEKFPSRLCLLMEILAVTNKKALRKRYTQPKKEEFLNPYS
jgi:hypothetical protein